MNPGLTLLATAGGKGGGGHHPRTHHLTAEDYQGQFSHASAPRAGSPVSQRGQALQCCLGEVQGPFSQVLQLARDRASLSTLVTSRSFLQQLQAVKGGGRVASFPSPAVHLIAEEWWGQFSHALDLQASSPPNPQPGSALLLSRPGAGPGLQSAVAGEG